MLFWPLRAIDPAISKPPLPHDRCLNDILEAEVCDLDDLQESCRFFLSRRVFEAFFTASQDCLLGIFPDTDHQRKSEFIPISLVQAVERLEFFRGEPIETGRTLVPQRFHKGQTFN